VASRCDMSGAGQIRRVMVWSRRTAGCAMRSWNGNVGAVCSASHSRMMVDMLHSFLSHHDELDSCSRLRMPRACVSAVAWCRSDEASAGSWRGWSGKKKRTRMELFPS